MDIDLQKRDELLDTLKHHLHLAKTRMKQQADKGHTERNFEIGDWVYLKLHPYRQKSLNHRPSQKLAPRFYGPFQITAKMGPVAYRLLLPPQCKLHPTFHVSLLKKKIGDHSQISLTLPPFGDDGNISWTPLKILDIKVE